MKVALVYDRINKWGGAERVLLALHKLFPNACLYTSVYSPEKAKWAQVFNVKTSFLQHFPNASKTHELYPFMMPVVFESFDFSNYELVISVTSEAAKGIITKPGTIHICYCLTPTRYLWSGYEEYFKNPFLRFLSLPIVSYLRKWDKTASYRPDAIIAISNEVKKRIKKYYKRDSEVIYPPLTISQNTKYNKQKSVSKNQKRSTNQQRGFFLVVSRLVPYKRIDLAIKACNELNLPLKIVGRGSLERKLKKISGPSIEFLGRLTDKELAYYYKNARALIFPGKEDFGLAMVEAHAFGKPVIAYKSAGALEIISKGQTGDFFEDQTAESLKKVLLNFDESRYNTLLLHKNAERFSEEIFKKKLFDLINKYIKIN